MWWHRPAVPALGWVGRSGIQSHPHLHSLGQGGKREPTQNALLAFGLALIQRFLTMLSFFSFGMVMYIVCHCLLEVCDLLFDFGVTGVGVKGWPGVSAKIRTLSSVETVKDYGWFWSWVECIFALWYGYASIGAREWNMVGRTRMAPIDSYMWMLSH